MSKALAAEKNYMTIEEYLGFEKKSKVKHEYMDGEIFSMAGAKRNHNLIGTNISTELNLQLREKNCEVYANDFRVRMRAGHYVYPDVAAACSEILTADNDSTLLNPVVIVEVLSRSTEKRDRGEKAEEYFKLDSLQDYILVSQNRVRVEHFSKQSNNEWKLKIYENLDDILVLDSIGCRFSLKLIYLKVKFSSLKIVRRKIK